MRTALSASQISAHHRAIFVVMQRRSFTPGVVMCGPEPQEGAREATRVHIAARRCSGVAAHRSQATKNIIPRLCFLTSDPASSRSTRFEAFFQGLRDLGYVDGRTIMIDYISVDGRGERFPSPAAECLRLKADVIAVSTTPATQAAKKATLSIPIIMIGPGDPVETGLVDSLAQPGGNVTRMSMMVSRGCDQAP
jgi:hypothetical protein